MIKRKILVQRMIASFCNIALVYAKLKMSPRLKEKRTNNYFYSVRTLYVALGIFLNYINLVHLTFLNIPSDVAYLYLDKEEKYTSFSQDSVKNSNEHWVPRLVNSNEPPSYGTFYRIESEMKILTNI